MKELLTLIYILRLKPIDFTIGIHQQISPKYLARRKEIRISFNKMKAQCQKAVHCINEIGITFEQTAKAIRMINGAFGPFYKQYIEGLRLEYNRYHECLNSPLWR